MGRFFKTRKKSEPLLATVQSAATETLSLVKIERRLLPLLAPTAFETEPYRVLAHMVVQLHKEAHLRTLAVSSPRPGDGKTSTAINLASILAQEAGARVLLLEADLRRPSVARYLDLRDTGKGLVEAILNPEVVVDNLVSRCPQFNLNVLLAGRSWASPADLLNLPRFGVLLQEFRSHYDWVIVDTPPILPFADCRIIEQWVDGLLLIVAANETPRKLLAEALNSANPAKLIGLVLNKDEYQAPHYYSTYRYYDTSTRHRY